VVVVWMVHRQLYRNVRDWASKALFAGGIGLLVIGLLLPVFADDTIAYVWWGLAGAVLPIASRGQHAKAK